MQDVNAQMVMKLHQMSGEPVANCHYLLTQTKGNYELALKIMQRILEQREADKMQDGEAQPAAAPAEPASPLEALEHRVYQLEIRFAQLADTLDTVSGKITLLLDTISNRGDQT